MRRLLSLFLVAVSATSVGAQGAPSLLGFGYPVGGMSARSLGTGTSITGLDPQSPSNPASIVLNARMQGYAQYEPERRTVEVGGKSIRTSTSRFPVFMATGRSGNATF